MRKRSYYAAEFKANFQDPKLYRFETEGARDLWCSYGVFDAEKDGMRERMQTRDMKRFGLKMDEAIGVSLHWPYLSPHRKPVWTYVNPQEEAA